MGKKQKKIFFLFFFLVHSIRMYEFIIFFCHVMSVNSIPILWVIMLCFINNKIKWKSKGLALIVNLNFKIYNNNSTVILPLLCLLLHLPNFHHHCLFIAIVRAFVSCTWTGYQLQYVCVGVMVCVCVYCTQYIFIPL